MARTFIESLWGLHKRQFTAQGGNITSSGGPVYNCPYLRLGNDPPVEKQFSSTYTEHYWSFLCRSASPNNQDFFAIRSGATVIATIRFTSRKLQLRINAADVALGSFVWSDSTWQRLEIRYKLADSGGYFETKINGALDAVYQNQDTKPGAVTSLDTFAFPGISAGSTDFAMITADDAGWIGSVKYYKRTLNGDSATNNAWGKSTGSTGYTLVDDAPPNDDTDYLYSTVNGQKQGHTCSADSLPSYSTIQAVITEVLGKGDGAIKVGVRSNGSEELSSTLALSSGAYVPVQYRAPLNPDGNVAWAQSALTTLETLTESVI